MIKEAVIGLLFLLNANGEPVRPPLTLGFSTLEQCHAFQADLRSDPEMRAIGEIYMVCILPEDFQRTGSNGTI